MKAVIYARYSSDNQREESIEGQLRECTEFAEKNGITGKDYQHLCLLTEETLGMASQILHVYDGELWLNKEELTCHTYESSFDMVISEIYSDCFFGRPITSLPEIYKINGALDDHWCVGDHVYCRCTNTYYSDNDSWHVEADMIAITESDFTPDPDVCYKPVIYLYPDEKTDVSVKLDINGKFTCTYPSYDDGWNVTGCQSFLNMPLLAYAHEIETPVLLVHGEKAHSRYFSEYAFQKMTGISVRGESAKVGNKELLIIPGASYCDLYDDVAGVIPHDRIAAFFRENLK